MKLSRWITQITYTLPVCTAVLGLAVVAQAQIVTQLATWDRAPDGTVVVGDDFDPTLDSTISCSGCWVSRTLGSGVTFSQSTTNGVTQGNGALQATIVGKGAGGEFSANINGSPVQLDTHFDFPLTVTYANTTLPAAGGPDPRFDAILAAVQGNQALFTVEFDITYDVAQMRSIPWQPPEETVSPETNGQFPQRFFWVGMHGNSSAGEFNFTGFDQNTINPFDAQWDNNLFPVFNASFPLTAFNFSPTANQTNFTFGILYNSVFGTLPAGSNTAGVNIFFDNFRLVELDLIGAIDFNNNGVVEIGDFEVFMSQHLVPSPTLGDFNQDGVNDFLDFQEFEQLFDAATGGTGSLARAIAGVPEPGTFVLAGLGLLGLLFSRARRSARSSASVLMIGIAIVSSQQTAQAQLIETWNTLDSWVVPAFAQPGSNPSITLSTTTGVTEGTTSLKVTQAEDTIGDGDFSWNATTAPNYTGTDPAFIALSNAVNIGAEHFNLLIDTTFVPAELIEQGVNSMTVTLGLNFVGQDAGIYSGETEQFTTTTVIPLSAFNLPDVEDQGAIDYSAQIGFNADGLNFPFSAYVDNIRIEQISTPDLLTLEIDRSDGSAILKNLTTNPIGWNYIEIKSPAGSLDLAGWNSLDDQNIGGATNFFEAGGSSTNALVEASLGAGHTLAPGATLALGNLYNEFINAEDIDLEIRRIGGPAFRTFDQLVTYIGVAPAGVAGDYNNNGIVDAADYTLWRDNLNSSFQLQNEGGISPGIVDQADFDFWSSRFGTIAGSGGGSLAGLSAVPEPSTFVLCLGAVVVAWAWRRRIAQ